MEEEMKVAEEKFKELVFVRVITPRSSTVRKHVKKSEMARLLYSYPKTNW
jgi:hypothetical protein